MLIIQSPSATRVKGSAGSQSIVCATLPEMIGCLMRDPQQWYKMNNLQPPEDKKEKAM